MRIPRNRLYLNLGMGGFILAIGLYFFLYGPLLKKLRVQGNECRTLEAEVLQARNLIALFKQRETQKTLISEKEVSQTIEEITREGNKLGINFVSVTPRTAMPVTGQTYQVMPIEMEIESTYQSLGEFLGLFDDLKGSLIKMSDFNVTKKGQQSENKILAVVTIHLYLAGPANG